MTDQPNTPPTAEPPPSPVAGYFATAWEGVISTLVGMRVTGRTLLTKPVTVQYPAEKPVIQPGFRGVHIYEMAKCIACDLCAKACPVDCITLTSEGKGKDAKVLAYQIDYNRCMFCGLCVEPCPTSCLHMGEGFDLSRYDSPSCVVDFAQLAAAGRQSPVGDRIVAVPPTDAPSAASGA